MVSLLALNHSSHHSNTSFRSEVSLSINDLDLKNNTNESHTRVWIKQTAIEEAVKRQKQVKNKNIRSSEGSVTSSNSSSEATPTARNTAKSLALNLSSSTLPTVTSSSVSNSGSFTSFGSINEKTPYGRTFLSSGNRNYSCNTTPVILPSSLLSKCDSTGTTQDTETSSLCTDVSCHSCRQALVWGWKPGYLVENSGGHLLVRLATATDSSRSGDSNLIRLPANALAAGDVVLGNDYNEDPDTGLPKVPHDLITLTHLHEPAVIESLQHRFAADQIYTNTGPVLIAMNPFQTVRGLYSEAVQKKYWEKAERNLPHELPPHVYAIADDSFRCMVRALEDISNGSAKMANQSILVSGESGAGKTVTTKFVMKYLAALSQRSMVLQKSNDTRAYLKANECANNNPSKDDAASKFAGPSPSRFKGGGAGAFDEWKGSESGVNAKIKSPLASRLKSNHSRSFVTSPTNEMTSVSSILAAGTCDDTSSSIEAQVLQSNPILESFGNARTVRNDNSSRFGKFIEIQFTQTGKLVGAQIETYLLEKVRLVTQTAGERNYHIFYELLSGSVDRRELSQYFLAHTAVPEDFKITACSGTFDRRDGVSDRETYAMLRQAMKTMNFTSEDIINVFRVTAAILHASNLTFVDIPGTNEEECKLDCNNVHLDPVCLMLGVSFEALNQALSSCNIQAGKSTIIKCSFNRTKAATGLEALLKETYGALFSYLVRCINSSIAFKGDRDTINDENKVSESNGDSTTLANHSTAPTRPYQKPAASVGVLDIFGFESFTVNSFEQLCINYCNEALQQQFNAFVLRNEQAEYEAEGIEWSFIEFPENQEALDLIDSSAGILRILDDQCRAPGPSDKAFAANVYQQCSSSNRFIASRKQQAVLKFSVLHYAGPVEYTADGFTEKNRDELPKESIDLLLQSEIPFVRELAKIMSETSEVSSNLAHHSPSNKRLHRLDSSVGRPTVGGQFRKQLKSLRNKIDVTTPHYIRCLKPNDNLAPEVFDTAIVAEQLRCGGILEAVRVARAGFTQHYLHGDFVRRYRALAWKELSSASNGLSSLSAWSGAPRTPVGRAIGHTRHFRNTSKRHSTGSYASTTSFLPSLQSNNSSKFKFHAAKSTKKEKPKEELTPEEAKVICQDLIKVLYRKIQQQEQEDVDAAALNDSSISSDTSDPVVQTKPPVSAISAPSNSKNYSARSWTIKSPESSKVSSVPKAKPLINLSVAIPSPSHQRPPTGGTSTNIKLESSKKSTTTVPTQPTWKKRTGTLSSSDYGKVGIQMGKTKVFLRHKAFEALERIRSTEQTKAATKLNSMFRRYLARIAYIPYRDAFRRELKDRMKLLDLVSETKGQQQTLDSVSVCSRSRLSLDGSAFSGAGSARPIFHSSNYNGQNLVDKWTESQIRDAIRNPIPRHKWGKLAPSHEQNFKWVISDEGLWVKNYNVPENSPND